MIVVVCAVLITNEDKILFIKESKEVAKGKLGLPGGKLAEGETLEACAVRECLEETGLHVQLKDLVMISQKPRTHEGNTVVKFVYSAVVTGQESDAEMVYDYYDKDLFADQTSNDNVRGQDVVWLALQFYEDATLKGAPFIRKFS